MSAVITPEQFIPRSAGILVVVLGFLTSIGWVFDIVSLKTIVPGLVAIKPNTVVCMVLAGSSLYLTATYQAKPIMTRLPSLLALLVFAIGLMTLSEDIVGWDLGIDQMLYLEPDQSLLTPHGGRMAIYTSIGFSLMGAALLMVQHNAWKIMAQGLALFTLALVCIPLSGYLFGNPALLPLGNFTVISPYTAVEFLLLSIGVLSLTMEYGPLSRLREKLPIVNFGIALLLLLLCTLAIYANTSRLIENNRWVAHTHEIRMELQGLGSRLKEIVADVRGFMLTDTEAFLATIKEDRIRFWRHYNHALQLTQDNIVQQKRLQQLKPLLELRIALDDERIKMRRERGLNATATATAIMSEKALNQQIHDRLNLMAQAEEQLMKEHQAKIETSTVSTYVTLFLAGFAALGLVLMVVLGLKRQLAERKRGEAILQMSEERFRVAAETANDVVYEWDLKQRVQWFGDIDQLLGYEQGEFPRTLDGWAAAVHPEDMEHTMTVLNAHLEGRAPYICEYRVRRKDGIYRWWTARGMAARTPDGTPVRMIGSITDISERIQKSDALRQRSDELTQFKDILDQTLDCVFMFDPDTLRFNYVNKGAMQQTGYSETELMQMTPLDIKPEFTLERFQQMLQPLIEGVKPSLDFQTVHRHKDGHDIAVQISLQFVRHNAHGAVFVAIVRDITEQKQQSDALVQRNDELDHFNRAMIGRELDMIALKEQINALSLKLGLAPPFALDFLETPNAATAPPQPAPPARGAKKRRP